MRYFCWNSTHSQNKISLTNLDRSSPNYYVEQSKLVSEILYCECGKITLQPLEPAQLRPIQQQIYTLCFVVSDTLSIWITWIRWIRMIYLVCNIDNMYMSTANANVYSIVTYDNCHKAFDICFDVKQRLINLLVSLLTTVWTF